MTFLQAFSMALAAIRAKKVRSLLTMLGTVIGVAAVIALVSVTEANNQQTLERMMWMGQNTLSVYAYSWDYDPTGTNGLSERLGRFINAEMSDLVLGVTPNGRGSATVKYGDGLSRQMQLSLGSEQFSLCTGYTLERGRDLCLVDILYGSRVCVIGYRTATALFGAQDPVEKTIMISGEPFRVVGTYAQKDFMTEPEYLEYSQDFMIAMPYTSASIIGQQLWGTDYTVKMRDAFMIPEATEELEDFLATQIDQDQNGYYYVGSANDYLDEISETNRQQTIFMACIAAISLLVGGIGIMNIMLVTVTERTREIGIRKAIGAPRRSIVTQFLIEASVLSLCGGLIGVVAGFVGTLFWGKMQYDLIVRPNLIITGIALLVSIALGIVFGVYPAFKASGLQPVVALRNE